jgi:amidase
LNSSLGAMGVGSSAIIEHAGLHWRQRDAHATVCGLSQLFKRFDASELPVAQVRPFAAAEHWLKRIEGRTMDTYHRWMVLSGDGE